MDVEPHWNCVNIDVRVARQNTTVGFGERCLWISVYSVLEQTSLLKVLLLDFLELFLV